MVMELLYVTSKKYVHLTFKDDGNFNIPVHVRLLKLFFLNMTEKKKI